MRRPSVAMRAWSMPARSAQARSVALWVRLASASAILAARLALVLSALPAVRDMRVIS